MQNNHASEIEKVRSEANSSLNELKKIYDNVSFYFFIYILTS